MDINYIILVHKNPQQVSRLVNRLSSEHCYFYIHVDKKVPIDPFLTSLSVHRNWCFVDKREDGKWGDLGIVKAVLHAFVQILQDKRTGYCILLSGQDYPLRLNEEINEFLANSNGCNFADTWAIPSAHWYKGGLDRILYYKFNLADGNRNYTVIPPLFTEDFRNNWRLYLRDVVRLLKQGKIPYRILFKRTFPKNLKPFGGSQWFAVTTSMAKMMLEFVSANKNYVSYHQHTLLPDEVFFQTLIMYFSLSTNASLQPSITYLRWPNSDAAHPVTLSSEHLNELKDVRELYPGKLFARKFNTDDDVLELIDQLSTENN